MELIREAGNMGKFYPSDCKALKNTIEHFNKKSVSSTNKSFSETRPRAIISPHAGYIYSGYTANAAHHLISNAQPKRIIVIGPSHHLYIDGISAGFYKSYQTPCGNLETDIKYLKNLDSSYNFLFENRAHYLEHSTETQMPFINYYNPQAKVIELIYGKTDWMQLTELIEYILSDKNNVVVISSDLSHFYPISIAKKLDAVCIEAIERKDTNLLDDCEACGITGIKAILDVADKLNLQTDILDYRTSADVSEDNTSVVGYASAVIW